MKTYDLFFGNLRDIARQQRMLDSFVDAAGGGNGVYIKHPDWHPIRVQVSVNEDGGAKGEYELVVEWYAEKSKGLHSRLNDQLQRDKRKKLPPWDNVRLDEAKNKVTTYVAKVSVVRPFGERDLMSPAWCLTQATRSLDLVRAFLAYVPASQ